MEDVVLNDAQKKRVLKTIDDDLIRCKLWAEYHYGLATTGSSVNRKIFHGTDGPEFTDDEKIEDSLNTMKNHIHRHDELSNLKKQLLSEADNKEGVAESSMGEFIGRLRSL